MATARKKQDEKNLKTLRELVSLPANKECFDCHQRGPTYVNMTIGSFVCTSCSGLLRGLTPPHRVKSISMATFNQEEIDLIRSRGNEYCRRIWLGLYDSNNVARTKDEQQIKDFMVAKYEKKRYYLEPSQALRNGPVSFSSPTLSHHSRTSTPTPTSITSIPETKPLNTLLGTQAKPLVLNVKTPTSTAANNMFTPDQPSSEFLKGFGSADPFSSSSSFSSSNSQQSFANFDNNPIFSSPTNLMFGSSLMNAPPSVAVHPKYNTNRWSMPTATVLSSMSPFSSPARKASSSTGFQPVATSSSAGVTCPPSEDRYAALKDLDSLMKTQQNPEPQLGEWSDVVSTASNSNPWNAKQDSSFGSSSSSSNTTMEGSFFESSQSNMAANPFTTSNHNNPWAVTSTPNMNNGFAANPFQMRPVPEASFATWSNAPGIPNGRIPNGIHTDFPGTANTHPATSHSVNYPTKMWHHQYNTSPAANPFAANTNQPPKIHPSNPFY